MKSELSFSELDVLSAELLPAREALNSWNVANVYATNASMAFNAATWASTANSFAGQSITVSQH